jgi:hypothetical protein
MFKSFRALFRKYVMPAEHGGWVLWIGPFVLGSLAAWPFKPDLLLLLLLIVAGFLARQPLVITTRALAGRRTRADLKTVLEAFAILAALTAALLGILLLRGNGFLLWLALPAVPVLAAQLWLVSRKQERQLGIELIGSGVLALAAPAAYWVGRGEMDLTGWWLWLLSWFYNASAIVYVYLRLRQRRLTEMPGWGERWRQGARTLLYASFNLGLSIVFAVLGFIPLLVMGAYLFALIHFVWGTSFPAVRVRPARVGLEQSSATLLFFLLVALAYRV